MIGGLLSPFPGMHDARPIYARNLGTIEEAFWQAGRSRREMAFFGGRVALAIDDNADTLREAILAEREACAQAARDACEGAWAAMAIEARPIP